MGFNWGAFAGGASEGFNKTYKMLKEEEERELIKEERRQALEAKAQSRAAARDTLGRAGTQIYDRDVGAAIGAGDAQSRMLDQQTAGFDDQQGVARATIESGRYAAEAPQGAIPTELKGRTYSEAEAMGDYGRRMAAIDPDKAIAVNLQSRQLRKLDRDEKKEIKLDELADEAGKQMSQIQQLSPDLGLYGLAQVAKKNGVAVEFVEAKDSMSPGKIVYTDPTTRKKVEITSFAQGQEALGQAVMMNYLSQTSLHMSPAQAMTMLKDRATIGFNERTTAVAEDGNRRANEKAPYEIGKLRAETDTEAAKARQADATARYLDNNKGEDNKTDPNTVWTKTIEPELIKQGYKPNEIQAQKDAYFARRGFAPPAAISAWRSGKRPDGTPLTEEDYAAIRERYPKTDFSQVGRAEPKPASAIPAKPGKPAAAAPAEDPKTAATGKAFEQARSDYRAAYDRLQAYGSKKQKSDPEGYAAAKKEVETLRAAMKKAEQEYQATLPDNIKSAFPR